MKRTTKAVLGLVALAAVLVLGVVSAGTALATSQFLYTGPLPVLVLVLSDGNQSLTVEPASETAIVTCKTFKGEVAVPATSMSSTTVKVNANYSTCTIDAGGAKVNVSPVEYEITATGLVKLLKEVTIGAVNGLCTVKVPTTGNSALEKVLFQTNKDGTLLITSDVTGVHSKVEKGNGVCGKEGTELTEGTFSGVNHVFAHGGTVSWDA